MKSNVFFLTVFALLATVLLPTSKALADDCVPTISLAQKSMAYYHGGFYTVWSFSGDTYESGNFTVTSGKLTGDGVVDLAAGSWSTTCYDYTFDGVSGYETELKFNAVNKMGIVTGGCYSQTGSQKVDGMYPCSSNGYYLIVPNSNTSPLWIVKHVSYEKFVGTTGSNIFNSAQYSPIY
nr:hypothetical protein [Marinicella sp. W31]MDC2877988.1 hypothetical protein [Marinicella sp. W31]